MLPISICMIMKNEEKNLRKCLDSIKGLAHELILVDTGSTDSTLDIAREYTNQIHHFDWIHDFSAARNYSLSLASNDWVLVLDCDESLSSIDKDSLTMFMKEHPYKIGLISRRNHYESNQTDSVYTDLVERFFNRNLYHYEGEVHEQVVPKHAFPCVGEKNSINLSLEHFGYVGSEEELHRKAMRDTDILKNMLPI